MNIALDYDGTFTEDPAMWDLFCRLAEMQGHDVYIVTMRYPQERITVAPVPMDKVWYTSRNAKAPFVEKYGLHIDVWIDDNPKSVHKNSNDELWPDEKREVHPTYLTEMPALRVSVELKNDDG